MKEINILTFDIEEWHIYKQKSYYGDSSIYLPRLEKKLNEILDLLEENEHKATFFCLGEVARKHPEILKAIDTRGHHIGCHSNEHKFLGDMTPEEFRNDTKLAVDRIEEVTGKKVDSYRAPAFSITEKTNWALESLVENGIEYDCSIFPAAHRFGGYPSFTQNGPSIITHKGISIKEFPIPLTNIFNKKFAFSGGGYFRLLPYILSKKLTQKNKYVMTYFHLRDFDAGLFKHLSDTNMQAHTYFKNFYGIKGAYSKFQLLLKDFDFISLKNASEIIDWNTIPVVEL